VWNEEVSSGTPGLVTEGMVVEIYAYNRGGEQYVRFTYRIQLDGDYINNCTQQILGVTPVSVPRETTGRLGLLPT
jgi:hypothetical protein